MKEYAPIIIFAFNRLASLKNTVMSLAANKEAMDSDLYVFVDGARRHIKGEADKVKAVQNYVKTIQGFKSLNYIFSETNKGLADSIINGTSDVISKYGRAIVVEDDLVVSLNFLSFINQGLERYERQKDVFSICGYSNKIKIPTDYLADSYFCTRSSSWGWGTWKDRWDAVNWNLSRWTHFRKFRFQFNKWGGSDCWQMLNNWHKGKNNSWAIRFCFSQFLQNKVSLFPTVSKVNNRGFDGSGTNCRKWSRFKFVFDESENKNFVFPLTNQIDFRLYNSAMSYHAIGIRIWSKLMYWVHK